MIFGILLAPLGLNDVLMDWDFNWQGNITSQRNPIVSAENLAEKGGIVAIDNEIIYIKGSDNTGKHHIQRGYYGTLAANHGIGAHVRFVDVHQTAEQLEPGPTVEVFGIDLSTLGFVGNIVYFVSGFQTDHSIPELIQIKSSRDMTDTNFWTNQNATCSADFIGPDGWPSAFQIVGTNTGLGSWYRTHIDVPNDGSLYHVKVAVRPRDQAGIELQFAGGTAVNYGFILNSDGTISTLSSYTIPSNLNVYPMNDGYYMIDFDGANNGSGNISLYLTFWPLLNNVNMNETGIMLVYSPQVFAPKGSILWGGYIIPAVPVQVSGFETSTRGALPTPHIKISNVIVGNAFAQLVDQYKDLVGARLWRWRIFTKNLDTGAEPDDRKYFRPDIFNISRKVSQNKIFIEWECASVIDQEGEVLPIRTLLRDYCPWKYRVFDPKSNSFDYSDVDCPYTGGALYDKFDNPVGNPADDLCSKHLTGCILRFGGGDLPIGAFPGVTNWR